MAPSIWNKNAEARILAADPMDRRMTLAGLRIGG
jgi:hypothetical protein